MMHKLNSLINYHFVSVFCLVSTCLFLSCSQQGGSLVWGVRQQNSSFTSYTMLTISNGNLYVGDAAHFFCFNAKTGRKIWEFGSQDGNSHGYHVVSDGYVYLAAYGSGITYCLNAQTGEKVWQTQGIYSSVAPAVSEKFLYLGSGYGLVCIDKQNGETQWQKIGAYSFPAISGNHLYVGGRGYFYCLDADTGNEVWKFPAENFVQAPAISNGYVYVGCADGKFYCLGALTGDKVWEFQTGVQNGAQELSAPAVSNGFVYFSTPKLENKIYCLAAETGEKVWEYNTNFSGVRSSMLAISDGYVYAGRETNNGPCICLDAKTGINVWGEKKSFDFILNAPVVSEGYLYGIGAGLFCFKAAEGDTGSWPMFQCNPQRTGAQTSNQNTTTTTSAGTTTTTTADYSSLKVFINPSRITLPSVGSTFTVDINIEGVKNLGSFQFDINYTPQIVSIENNSDITLGDFIKSTGRNATQLGPDIDSTSGTVILGSFTFGDSPGPDGRGVLATIKFTVKSRASGTLNLDNVAITDIDGTALTVDTVSDATLVTK
jgi:outer membrane protein assembly factor BamB